MTISKKTLSRRLLPALIVLCFALTSRAGDGLPPVPPPEKVDLNKLYEHLDPGTFHEGRWFPVSDWRPNSPSRKEKAAGMLCFVCPDPGEYLADRIPKPAEQKSSLSSFLTPGEYEPIGFGIYGLDNLSGVDIGVDTANSGLTIDARYIHCWPQRTGWKSDGWCLTPELLLPFGGGMKTVPYRRGILKEEPFTLGAGRTAAFWLTVHAPVDAKPGKYQLTMNVKSAGRPSLAIPLEIEILPFKLKTPDNRYWLLYYDAYLYFDATVSNLKRRKLSDEQIMLDLDDIARHGLSSLVGMPLGTPDLSRIKEGQINFEVEPYRKMVSLCRKAGLNGPPVCVNEGIPERVVAALGLNLNLRADPWPENLKKGVADTLKAAVAATSGIDPRWFFYGSDEPAPANTYALQLYQCAHDSGAKTFTTLNDMGFFTKGNEILSAACFMTRFVADRKLALEAQENTKRCKSAFWCYGTGCYVNEMPQERSMFPNRYGAGCFFWKTGAEASASWVFCRPAEDAFNDLDGIADNSAEPKDQCIVYPHFLKPDDWSTYQGAIPTIAWESLREGIDDFKYFHTLDAMIKKIGGSDDPKLKEAAAETRMTFDELCDAIPWGDPMSYWNFSPDRIQEIRRMAADMIVGLMDAEKGKGKIKKRLAETAERIRAFRKTNPCPPETIAPFTGEPPLIDGKLDERGWKAAPETSDFVWIIDNQPARFRTTAKTLWDKEHLYVAFHCEEPFMKDLAAKQTGRDPDGIWLDDSVELFIGADADRNQYTHIIVNTSQAVYDELHMDKTWDSDAKAGVFKGADFWNVEIAVPWKSLEKTGIRPSSALAMNFCRARHASWELCDSSAWSNTYGGFHAPKYFGTVKLQK